MMYVSLLKFKYVLAAVLAVFAVMPFGAAASEATYKAAMLTVETERKEVEKAEKELDAAQKALAQAQSRRANAEQVYKQRLTEYNAAKRSLEQAKPAQKKKLEADVKRTEQARDQASETLRVAKFEESKAQGAIQPAKNKLSKENSDLIAAKKRADKEKPLMYEEKQAVKTTVKEEKEKVVDWIDFQKMEKAVKAASLAVGKMKNPPEKVIAALDTMGSYLGYINTGIDIVGSSYQAYKSLRDLIDAGKMYKNAILDSDKRAAVLRVSIATLNTLEKFANIKGGVISTVAAACNQFFTAMIKMVANAAAKISEHNYDLELLRLVSGRGYDYELLYRQSQGGYAEIAVKMLQDGKQPADISSVVAAAKTLRESAN